jgi:hypothetical protein
MIFTAKAVASRNATRGRRGLVLVLLATEAVA